MKILKIITELLMTMFLMILPMMFCPSNMLAKISPLLAQDKVILPFIKHLSPFVRQNLAHFNEDLKILIKESSDPLAYPSPEGIIITTALLDLEKIHMDTLALILCHEIGHSRALFVNSFKDLGETFQHILVPDESMRVGHEARADYFASRLCFPYFLKEQAKEVGLSPPLENMIENRTLVASNDLISFLYHSWYTQEYIRYNLPIPQAQRDYLGAKDVLQCRLINLLLGLEQAPPQRCPDIFQ